MKKVLMSVLLTATFLFTTVFAGNVVERHQKKLDVLFIQVADGGSLTPIKDRPGYYQLQLNGVKEYVGYFSNRPARVSGIYPTDQFIARWEQGTKPNSFNKMPPNADLNTVIPHAFKRTMVNLPLQLSEPNYNATQHTISYVVQILPGAKAKLPLKRMGQTALFIDNYCVSCVASGF